METGSRLPQEDKKRLADEFQRELFPFYFLNDGLKLIIIRQNTDEYNIYYISKCNVKAGQIDSYITKSHSCNLRKL